MRTHSQKLRSSTISWIKNASTAATRFTLTLACLMGLAQCATAQLPEVVWRVPPKDVTVKWKSLTLASEGREVRFQPKLALTSSGYGAETLQSFVMLKHRKVTITSEMPEPGLFEVVVDSPDSQVEVKTIETTNEKTVVEIVTLLPMMSRDDLSDAAKKVIAEYVKPHLAKAQQEAKDKKTDAMKSLLRIYKEPVPKDDAKVREAYVPIKAVDLGEKEVKVALDDWLDQRKAWFSDEDRAAWRAAKEPEECYRTLKRVIECDEANKYLQSIDIDLELKQRNAETLVMGKFDGVYALLSGKTVDEEESREGRDEVRSLTQDEMARFRAALIVHARCHFVPNVDKADGNAQWFHGQRVLCLARGISGVTITGSLNPKGGDRVDWWQLLDYSPDQVAMIVKENPRLKSEVIVDRNATCLRLWCEGTEPVSYTVQFQPRKSSKGAAVEIHESPASAQVKFPF